MKESDRRPYGGFAKTLKGPLNEPLKKDAKERNKNNNLEQLSVEMLMLCYQILNILSNIDHITNLL